MPHPNESNVFLGKQTTAFIDVEDDASNMRIDEEAAIREYRHQLYDEFKNTLDGYRQLSTEKGSRKIFWIFLMTSLTAFAVYLSYHMLRDFGYRTALEYEHNHGVPHLDYPTITICGNNPVYSPMSFTNFPLNITLKQFKTFYFETLSRYSYAYKTSNASKAVLKALYAINITSYKEILQLFENTIDESLDTFQVRSCFQGGRRCNVTTDFRETLMIGYNFLCHQWNYYDEKKISKRQIKSHTNEEKLTMLLDVHADYQLNPFGDFHSVGLYIHPYGTPHYLSQHTELIGLQTGKYTTINIELTEINLLPSPYSTNCGSKELSIVKNFPYSKVLCEVDFILVKVYEKCKCISFAFEGYMKDIPICSAEQMKCYFNFMDVYKDSCVDYASTCPLECTYYEYNIRTSRLVDIANERIYGLLINKKDWTKGLEETKKYAKRNLLRFSIGFKSLSKKVENYVPLVTTSGLIGTLGGSIGLCLGFSFVTVFEVLIFIYDYVTARWKINAKKLKGNV